MSSANGVGIELFQFIEPASQLRLEENNFEYWKTGYFHICITEPNIEEFAEKIASTGVNKELILWNWLLALARSFAFAKILLAT
jgi:hypothetical protein